MPEPAPDCRCAGRDLGRHGLLCERLLRDAFGDLGNAPDDIKTRLRERGTVVPDTPPGGHVRNPGKTPAPRRARMMPVPGAVWSPDETALPGSPGFGRPGGVPAHAHQVTIRYASVSGHEFRDVVVMTDDYALRRDDGTLDAYLRTVVLPVLKRDWYPFPVDTGRYVLPVVLRDGEYVEDPEAPNPLDAFSGRFPDSGPPEI